MLDYLGLLKVLFTEFTYHQSHYQQVNDNSCTITKQEVMAVFKARAAGQTNGLANIGTCPTTSLNSILTAQSYL